MTELQSPLLTGLNPDQQRAVTTTEGPVLVVAGPGSGKTRVLTHRIGYLIQERNVSPDQILAVTFTNKAAREMRERIDRLIGEEATDGLVMGTFHSLGVRMLRENPYGVATHLDLQRNFVIYDGGDQMELAKTAVKNAGLDPKQVAPRRMLSRISAAKSVLMTANELADEAESYDDEVVVRVYKEYEKLLRAANAVDFDDLLGLPIRLFDADPAILERYQQRFRYILVDEYQDTNRVQYVMISALADQHRNLFVVGDPDQSIYGWRQADIRNILDFRNDYPDTTQINLEINYRSTQRIVQAADRVIQENEQRIDRKIRTINEEGELIQLRELADQQHEAQFIVSEIRRIQARGIARPEDIAVMYRTTAQSRVLEEAFRTSEFRYRIVGGVRFYERKEVRDILAVLRLLYNPSDNVSLQRVIDNFPIGRGFGPKAMETASDWATEHSRPTLEAFLALTPSVAAKSDVPAPVFSGVGRTAASRIGTTFSILMERKNTLSLAELFDSIVEVTDYRASFDGDSEEELQRWANVQELRNDLERYDHVDPEEALPAYLEQVALIADVDSMDEDGGGSVTLITLHSAKGLEFPVVFIAGAEEGLLPISRAVEAEAFDPLPMEEERRLFYVGITRAEKILYITFAANRMSYGQFRDGVVSRFVGNIPAEAMRSSVRESPRRASSRGRSYEKATPGSFASKVSSSWSMPEPTPKLVPEPIPDYQVGNKVFHPKFGEGQINEIVERRDGDKELGVLFARHGAKRLIASMAKMDILS
ncbi:MAG TPA: UvrD-helicase domain-containing protein [Thermomicrobiales bacterium]|nr:UvrD-helicase domain-containing protein [Thermomicrobiales bacterium]